jgi:hypothetical protein
LAALQLRINSEREGLLAEIQKIDADWDRRAERRKVLQRLEELYRLLSYFTRWSGQLQERIVRLAL